MLGRRAPLITFTLSLVTFALACGDDSNDGGDTQGTQGTDPGTGPGTGSADGSSSAEAGSADAGETQGQAETGETGVLGCSDHEDEASCDADPECMSIRGRRYKTNGGGNVPCLEPIEFLSCEPSMDCGQAETWFCQDNNNNVFLVSNTCGPENMTSCDPPPEPIEDCV